MSRESSSNPSQGGLCNSEKLQKAKTSARPVLTDKTSKGNLAVYIYFCLITICRTLELGSSHPVYIALFAVGCTLLVYKILQDAYSKKEFLVMGGLLLLGALCFMFGEQNTVILVFAISICCLKNVNIKTVIKIIFWTKLLIFSAMVVLSLVGILDDTLNIYERPGMPDGVRYTFGFSHPNVMHANFITIACAYYYCYHKEKRVADLIGIAILNYILYLFSVSRTGLILVCLLIVVVFLTEHHWKINRILMFVIRWSYILVGVLSISLALLYNSSYEVRKIDTLTSGRIRTSSIMLRNYPIPLIGKEEYAITADMGATQWEDVAILDNSYIYILYSGGLLVFLFYSYMIIYTMNSLYSRKRNKEMIVMFIMCVLAFSERILLNVTTNFGVLFFQECLFGNRQQKNKPPKCKLVERENER